MTLSITSRHPTDRTAVLVLRGVINYDTATDLRAAISAATARQPSPRLIVIDLDAVTSVDDIGVGTLVVARRICRDIGIDLAVRRPSPTVRQLLGITGYMRRDRNTRRAAATPRRDPRASSADDSNVVHVRF